VRTLARHLGAPAEEAPPRPALSRPARLEREEIAVVGFAGRFPGAWTVEDFWRNLLAGVESIRTFTEEEVLAAGADPALVRHPAYVRAGAVFEGVELFDAPFFGYNPREAEVLDPQQRMFLECAWEALERSGCDPGRFPGRIGVFAGGGVPMYLRANLDSNPALLGTIGGLQLVLANDKDFLATRVSYKLGLRGPSVSVQTACSTSLVALHMACQSLLLRECEMALAGGASVQLPQRIGYLYQPGMVVSPDGHCRAFDARARGTLSGDGAGVLVLRRLSDALAGGDPVHAVIKGSAINNDGALKVGFTAPSIAGQAEAIAEAHAAAGVAPETIGYVEAHGTGTELGDPIEVAALTQAFRRQTEKRGFCALGSVKTNIGHLAAAAGAAGLIKACLALKHEVIPPSLHFEQPNPAIDFAASPFFVNTELRPWPANGTPRRAGVSSFGLGGTNAHVVVEEAPPAAPSGPSRPWQLLLLSARTESALRQAAENLAGHLEAQPDLDPAGLADVAFTLEAGRKAFDQRLAVVARTPADAAEALRDPSRSAAGRRSAEPAPVAFLFPGQGAQEPGMGAALYRDEPVYRAEVDRCAEALLPHLGLDLRTLLHPAPGAEDEAAARLQETAFAQPALFTVEHALAQLWISWGLTPRAMIGHSLGEYVAACVAGVLPLDDALELVALRGRLLQALPPGAMLAVAAPAGEVEPLLAPALALAAVNAPEACTVSGPPEAVAAFAEELRGRGIEHRRLRTSHAFHSAMMDPVLDELRRAVSRVRLATPAIPYVSNLTGTWITAEQATDPDAWAAHLRRPVRFAEGVRTLAAAGAPVLLEVGPGKALATFARRGRGDGPAVEALSSWPRPDGEEGSGLPALLRAYGRLWIAGAQVDPGALFRGQRRRRAVLPTYPFERQKYWIEPGIGSVPAQAAAPPRPTKRSDVADWFYRPSWEPVEAPAAEGSGEDAVWLVLADRLGVGERVAARLQEQGREVTLATPGPEVDGALLDRTAAGRPLRIVHLGRLAPEGGLPASDAALQASQELGFHSLAAWGSALASRPGAHRIDAVSSDMQAIDGTEILAPDKATLLGPCRAIPLEAPAVSCRSIDLSLAGSPSLDDLAAAVLRELGAPMDEPVVAWRGGRRWRPAYLPVRLEEDAAPLLRECGVYLITGGLGGIGLTLARHLAEAVRARLVLVGRGGLSGKAGERRRLAVEQLERSGAEVLVCAADVADRAQMTEAVAAARARFGALHGVIHSAGVPGAGSLQLHDRAAREAVLAPKVAGTLVLDEILAGGDAPPDFVLLCSSLAATLGGFGQADYCAANAFLDAYAHLPRPWRTLSVAWDSWREVGMAVDADLPADLEALRARSLALAIAPAEGVEAFRRALAAPLRQILVSTYDLAVRRAEVSQAASVHGTAAASRPATVYRRPGLATPYTAPRTALERSLAELWERLLGVEPVGIHDDFFELGGHSLLATQLITWMRDTLGVEMALREVFDEPTVAGMAARIEAVRNVLADRAGRARPSAESAAPAPVPPIVRVPRDAGIPLSFAQQRLWFLDRLLPENPFYNMPGALRLEGGLDVGALAWALREVARRHETLRTTFPLMDGEPVQRLSPLPSVHLAVADLSALPAAACDAEARRLVVEEAHRPFDLQTGPLLRAALLRRGPREHDLLMTMHHIVSDGWSIGILHRELAALYDARRAGRPSPLPELPVQYADFAVWQRSWLSGAVLAEQLGWWKRKIGERPPALRLPTDRPRPAVQAYRGAILPVHLPPAASEALGALARERGATLAMVLLAAFQTLLLRITGQERVLVGSPIANRTRGEIEGLIGFFVNTLVMAGDLSGDPAFPELLDRVREDALGAYAHQDLPFEKLVVELALDRDLGRNPLFQVLFALQNAPVGALELGGLALAPLELEIRTTHFDLELDLWETPGGLAGLLFYDVDLFTAATIERLAGHFRGLVEGLADRPGERLSDLPLLTAAERRQLLVEWQDLAPAAPPGLLDALVAEQAARTPGAVAVVDESGATLTFRELERRAARLAATLRRNGVCPETVVGLYAGRSTATVTGLLAVLAAGGAYLPLDPDYPRERLELILEDSGAPVVLAERNRAAAAAALCAGRARMVLLDEENGGDDGGEDAAAGAGHDPESLAYVLYTSGSTGRPKGVQVPHRAVVNFLASMRRRPGLGAGDVLLAVTTLSFDIAALEIFLPLVTGARLVVAERETAQDGLRLARALDAHGATAMQATPATWRLLVASGWRGRPGLKILCGGEALPRELAEELRARGGAVWNLYGPTETTIWSAAGEVEATGPVTLGGPIAGTRILLLDAHLQPLPVGVPGEVYIGGTGLARGYLGRPELTAERFLPDPFPGEGGEAGGRLYRVGDLARRLPGGRIEWLGRVDDQLKLRGFRIEPGEVEAALRAHPAVTEAVVVARGERGEDCLLACVVAPGAPGTTADLEALLRSHLAGLLPPYMIPARLARLDRLPRTPNGKVDRRALLAEDPWRAAGGAPAADGGELHTALERQLAAVWREVLGVERVGPHDSFFDLGGHSLLAIRLLDQVRRRFGRELPVVALFQAPTVERLARLLTEGSGDLPWSPLVPLQPRGGRPPFYCVHPIMGVVFPYLALARRLGPEQPFYALQARGLDGREPPHTRVEEMAACYVEAVRRLQPHGPYRLGGWSSGGWIAFEMARQLNAAGEEVERLVLIDTPAPLAGRSAATWAGLKFFTGTILRHIGPYVRDYLYLALRPGEGGDGRNGRAAGGLRRFLEKAAVAELVESDEQLVLQHSPTLGPLLRVFQASGEATLRYAPPPFAGRLVLLRTAASMGTRHRDEPLGWSPLVEGGVEVHRMPGNHMSLLREPHVDAVAARLLACLE
jgi:amino acid adenylation domain-containing protein